jgi:hypothetical protein
MSAMLSFSILWYSADSAVWGLHNLGKGRYSLDMGRLSLRVEYIEFDK